MEVPVAHHLGAAQHICVERIRPVHILNRQTKVLKTEDTLPERCVVACCHSYYSFSTGFLGTDEICAASGRDRRAAYQPNEIASPQPIEMHPLPFARATRIGRDQGQGRAAARNFDAAFDRFESFTTDAVKATRAYLSAFAGKRTTGRRLGTPLCANSDL